MIRSERCRRSPSASYSLGKTFQFECRAGSTFCPVPRKNTSQVKSKRLICRIKCRPTIFCVLFPFWSFYETTAVPLRNMGSTSYLSH